MSKKRRNHSASFKAKVALSAIKGDKTMRELSSLYTLNPVQIQKCLPAVGGEKATIGRFSRCIWCYKENREKPRDRSKRFTCKDRSADDGT